MHNHFAIRVVQIEIGILIMCFGFMNFGNLHFLPKWVLVGAYSSLSFPSTSFVFGLSRDLDISGFVLGF